MKITSLELVLADPEDAAVASVDATEAHARVTETCYKRWWFQVSSTDTTFTNLAERSCTSYDTKFCLRHNSLTSFSSLCAHRNSSYSDRTWLSRSLHKLAFATILFRVPPTPSCGPLPWDVAKKLHAEFTSNSSLWKERLAMFFYSYTATQHCQWNSEFGLL